MGPEIRVLLLEDSPLDAELVQRELGRALPQVRVLHVTNEAEFRTALYEADVSLVLSDNKLPGLDALGALEIVHGVRRNLPFIVVSGTVGEDHAVEMLRAGVTDYVLKDRLSRLAPVVERALDEAQQRLRARLAAERAREANERFKTLAEHTPVGIFQVDADMRYTHVNPRWLQICGFSAEEVIGREWGTLGDPELARRIRLDAFKAGEMTNRFQQLGADGERQSLLMTSRAVSDDEGVILGWVGTVVDLTAEVRAEEEAQEANERFRTMAESAPVGIFQMDAELRYEYMNPRWCEITQLSAEDTLGRRWGSTLAPEWGQLMAEQAATARELTDTVQFVRPDGETRSVLMHARQVLGPGGVIRGWIASLMDITEALRAEEEAREANERFKVMAEQAPIGIFLTDAEDLYTYVNPRWTELTGMSAEATLGRRMGAVIPSPQAHGAFSVLRQIDEGSMRVELPRPDATMRVLLVTSKGLIGAAGHPTGRVGTVADITDETRAQQALAEARDRAAEASELKSHFLANMSHEIRTPMIGVIGMTDLLLETSLDAQQRDYAETLRSSGKALLAVINDVLDFSKVEAGKLAIDSQAFNVERVVNDVTDLMATTAQAKGVELVTCIDDSLPAIVGGDAGRVRQVLTNLIGNAIKFTPAGYVAVRAGVREQTGDEVVLCFDVSDSGDGIPSGQLDRIFQPFTQADTSTSRKYGGSGLGLAISRQLVELMGGEINAVSRPGEGSTFSFTIQAYVIGTEPSEQAAPDLLLKDVRTLVVDDSALQREVIVGYLRTWGMAARPATSGTNALGMLRSARAEGRPISLAVVDEAMPGVDGPTLVRAIASDPTLDTRILLMRDLAQSSAPADQDTLGIAVVSKPIHRDDLHIQVHRALGHCPEPTCPTPSRDNGRPATRATAGHLLLAEDNLINQKVTVAMLSSAGYRVDTVPDGSAAVAAAAAHPYDAILMDCQMPGLNGYQATAAIRSREGTRRHTPIIALTAAARHEDRERCLAEGMDDYLAKPVSKVDLLTLVGASMRS